MIDKGLFDYLKALLSAVDLQNDVIKTISYFEGNKEFTAILYFRALSLCSWNMRFLFISRDTTTDTFFRIVFHTDSSLLVFFRLNTRCYDKHALRADAPIPRMFSLSSCTMTLLYLCLTDTDTIIPLRLPPPVSPPVWPSLLFYFCTIPCSLVPVTSHLYSLIWYALDPMMYISHVLSRVEPST